MNSKVKFRALRSGLGLGFLYLVVEFTTHSPQRVVFYLLTR